MARASAVLIVVFLLPLSWNQWVQAEDALHRIDVSTIDSAAWKQAIERKEKR